MLPSYNGIILPASRSSWGRRRLVVVEDAFGESFFNDRQFANAVYDTRPIIEATD
jgi:hypothetical protein